MRTTHRLDVHTATTRLTLAVLLACLPILAGPAATASDLCGAMIVADVKLDHDLTKGNTIATNDCGVEGPTAGNTSKRIRSREMPQTPAPSPGARRLRAGVPWSRFHNSRLARLYAAPARFARSDPRSCISGG